MARNLAGRRDRHRRGGSLCGHRNALVNDGTSLPFGGGPDRFRRQGSAPRLDPPTMKPAPIADNSRDASLNNVS